MRIRPLAVLVEHIYIVRMMRELFDVLWKASDAD